MSLRFTVLASGSAGNASLLDAAGFQVLLDIGLGPRQIASRLAAVGASWQSIGAVLLTHTHSDHWREATLVHLCRRGIPLYCHAEHQVALASYAASFRKLREANLIRSFGEGEEIVLSPGLRCLPLTLRHDGGPTFGFRFIGKADLFGHAAALAYAADLGSWTNELAQALADVDLLALEFNHDVLLEQTSGRSPQLIARVLGESGHLSNGQAARLLSEVLMRSPAGRLRQVVQLHLSRECNRPELAWEAARQVVDAAVEIITAAQEEPTSWVLAGAAAEYPSQGRRRAVPGSAGRLSRAPAAEQAWLPGIEV